MHRTDCVNINDLFAEENRMIDVYWYDDIKGTYSVEIEVLANDRAGLLRDIIKQLDNSKARLMGVNTRTTKTNIAIINICFPITSACGPAPNWQISYIPAAMPIPPYRLVRFFAWQ